MWVFNTPREYGVEIDPTEREFFVTSQVDRSSALIRETVQNSLDARRPDAEAVEARFAFHEGGLLLGPDVMDRYLAGLMPHLRACSNELSLDEVDFDHPRFLVVEDFGTQGLRGDPLNSEPSDFYYFWRVVGRSGKGHEQGGRWGLGKTVFPNSSQLSAFLGYTVRADDRRALLSGQVSLKTHDVDGVTYLPFAFYTPSRRGERERPFEDDATLTAFCRDFRLTRRRDEPGLSIVVPFPYQEITEKSLLEAAILHYFFPILAGRLVVRVNDTSLDRRSIERLAIELRSPRLRDSEKSLAFARDILQLPGSGVDAVDNPAALNGPRARIPREAFAPDRLDQLRKRFLEGALVAVRIPVAVQPRHADAVASHVKVFLKRDPGLIVGQDHYIRGGISVTGLRFFGGRQAFGLLLADDEPVSRFLGDAENPSHTSWNPNSRRLAALYRGGRDLVLFLRECMTELVDTLLQAAEEEDTDALLDVFYTPRAQPPKEPGPAETGESKPARVEGVAAESGVVIEPLSGGFKLVWSGPASEGTFPLAVKAQVAYEIRQGNPLKKYHPDDFDLGRVPITVEQDGVKRLRSTGCRMDFVAEKPEFAVKVSGFDPNRDLRVRVEAAPES
jgi:hypothetical protein